MPDELPDQVITHGVHHMTLFQVAEPVQQITHLQRHRGFPGTRLAGKAHVQVRPRGGEAELLPHPIHEQQRGDLLDLLLDRQQADQLPVKGGEHLVDARLPALVPEADRRVRSQRHPLITLAGSAS